MTYYGGMVRSVAFWSAVKSMALRDWQIFSAAPVYSEEYVQAALRVFRSIRRRQITRDNVEACDLGGEA